MTQTQRTKEVTISAENIGGIDETAVEFVPGVNVLAGRNATNRTSLLQAVMAALGSNQVSVKGDADKGYVTLSMGDETYERRLARRADGSIAASGSPYLEDATIADLFAFLLESNEARRAVTRRDDLRNVIMRPVDTEAIHEEVEQLEAEKRRIDNKLEELEAQERRLPELEGERTRIKNQIEEKQEALAEKQAEIEAADVTVDERREEQAEIDEKLAKLREARSELEDIRFDIKTEEESIQALQGDHTELESEHDELPDAPAGELGEIEAEMERTRKRRMELESTISELQSVIQFNEEMLEGSSDIRHMLDEGYEEADGEGALTDQLLDAESITCWTCGSDVDMRQIERTLDVLRSLREEKLSEKGSLSSRLSDLTERRNLIKEAADRRQRVSDQLNQIETRIEQRDERLSELRDRSNVQIETIESLEAAVEDLDDGGNTEILDLHKEANQLEFELDRLRADLEEIENRIETIEGEVAGRESREVEREEVAERLSELRTRIQRIEERAVEEFNEQMATVLDLLGYENIARIWIERTEQRVREGRRKVTKSMFDLHVIRNTAEGTTYEDTIDHLSESEREVTGLVFALAGYLVHEVYETVPFMLLDSLEAIDSERIATLVEYFTDYADYLVVALLPEDSAAVDERHHRVSEI